MGANIGQAVFNVAALVVSYYAGPLAGALVSSAGQALFPAGADVKGPRAQDQGFTSSQVGLDIPLVIGTQKVTGNVIWAADIVEHKKKESAKGSQPKAISYSYTRSFSVMLCDGPISGVRMVWRNGVVVYDRRPQGDDETDADYRERDAANTKFEQRLRVYLGTEDQLPDPLQEADKGVGKVPAYRGKAYITLENEDITDMGGRVPNFEFEVVERGVNYTQADPEYLQEVLAPWTEPVGDPRTCGNGYTYRFRPYGIDPPYGFTDLITALAQAEAWYDYPESGIYQPQGFGLQYSPNGAVYADPVYPNGTPYDQKSTFITYTADYGNFILPEDVITPGVTFAPKFIAQGVELNTPFYWNTRNTDGTFRGWAPGVFYFWTEAPPNGPTASANFITTITDWPGVTCYLYTIPELCLEVQRVPSIPGTLCNPLCGEAKPLLPEDSRFCVLDDGNISYAGTVQKSDASTSWKILVDPLPYYAPDGSVAHLPAIPDWDDRYSDQAFWEAAAERALAMGIEIPAGPIYPKPLYGVNYPINKVGPGWKVLQKYSASSSTVTKYPLGPALPSFDSRYTDSTFWTNAYIAAKAVYGTDWPSGIEDGLTYNTDYPVTQTYAYARVPPDIAALYSDDVTLASAVTELSQRCGLSDEQIDVSELTETLHGIRVASNSSGRSIIQQLQQFGFFDAVEVDGLLKFPLRGKDVVATLGEDDLGAHTPGEDMPPLVALERAEPAELPKQINVHFDDVDNEYQSGSMSGVWLTDDASSSSDVTLSIAMDSAKAQKIAEVLITEAWIQRETAKLLIMPNWLKLAAGDAILVPLEGRTERVRIIDTDMPLPAGAISASAVRNDASIYTSYREGLPAVNSTPRPQLIGPTKMVILDIQPYRPGESSPGFYVAALGLYSGWDGCSIEVSADDQASWITAGIITKPAIVGTVSNALPPGRTSGIDDLNSLTVSLSDTDQLQSVSESQLANANLSAVGVLGRWEALNFATHVDNGDGTRALSTLLRGRLDTEAQVATHTAGESFVFLDDALLYVPLDDSTVNRVLYVRAVSLGQSEGSAAIIQIQIDDSGITIIDGGGDDDDGGGDDEDVGVPIADLAFVATLDVPICTVDALSGSLYGAAPGKSIRQYDATSYALLSGVNVADSDARLCGVVRIGTDFYVGAFFFTNSLIKASQTAVDTNDPGLNQAYAAGAGQPQGLCVLGSDVWITRPYGPDNQLAKIDVSTMTLASSLPIYGQALATDDTNLYLSTGSAVKCVQPSDGATLWTSISQPNICHLVVESGYVWAQGSESLNVYSATDGALVKSIPATSDITGTGAYGGDLILERRTIRSNGSQIFIAMLREGTVYTRCYDASTLELIKRYEIEGVNCWVIGENGSDVIIYAHDLLHLEADAETHVYQETI